MKTARHTYGTLKGTRDALVGAGIRAHLAEQGWDHQWPEVPKGMDGLPGRPTGRTTVGGLSARLPLSLPEDLSEHLTRASWHLSKTPRLMQLYAVRNVARDPNDDLREPARQSLRAGIPGVFALEGLSATPSDDERSSVLTTGDLIRGGAWRALDLAGGH